jgi:hypothetical protein
MLLEAQISILSPFNHLSMVGYQYGLKNDNIDIVRLYD